MRTNYEIRYAAHPEDAKSYDTKRIRRDFLIEKVFSPNEVNMVYSMYDRMVVGGAMPPRDGYFQCRRTGRGQSRRRCV